MTYGGLKYFVAELLQKVAELVVSHARQLFLKLFHKYPHYGLFYKIIHEGPHA